MGLSSYPFNRSRKNRLDLKRKVYFKKLARYLGAMSGCLRNVPFLENSAVFNISKEDQGRDPQNYHRSWKFKILSCHHLFSTSSSKNFTRVGKRLNWLIWSSISFLFFLPYLFREAC